MSYVGDSTVHDGVVTDRFGGLEHARVAGFRARNPALGAPPAPRAYGHFRA